MEYPKIKIPRGWHFVAVKTSHIITKKPVYTIAKKHPLAVSEPSYMKEPPMWAETPEMLVELLQKAINDIQKYEIIDETLEEEE